MAKLTLNFIGCGRLGKTLAALCHQSQVAEIGGLLSASHSSALQALQFIGAGQVCKAMSDLPPADLYFITTPDDLIQKTCEALVTSGRLKTGAIVLHCSGSLNSDSLASARAKGCHLASLHPLKSFASPEESLRSFKGSYCALEGDQQILGELSRLMETLGAKPFIISKEAKALYHTASVLANNYLVTLHYQARECYKQAGIDDAIAEQLVSKLMKDAFNNLASLSHQTALTGPLQRGDASTIESHLKALSAHPTLKDLYSALGKATLDLTEHSEDKKSSLRNLLSED